MENATEFFDKSGERIYIGDVLQTRLGKFAKSGGPTTWRVIRFGKRIQLVDANDVEHRYGGRDLTQQVAALSVVVEREPPRSLSEQV